MKQVFCITAYKDFEYLKWLAAYLADENCYVYIHVDKKTSNEELLSALNSIENVTAISKFSVPWGGYQHLASALELIKLATKDIDGRFYAHVITGQDMLCKSKSELFEFFNEENFCNYMSCSDGERNRFRYRTFYRNDWINYKTSFGNFATKALHVLQKAVFINRKPPFGYKIYKGMLYVTLTSEFSNFVIEFLETKNGKKYFNWIKWCFVPEEFFFQTLIKNSEFDKTLVPNNIRYALWADKHGVNPGILDKDDFDTIVKSGAFFARKISPAYSKELVEMLEKNNG